MRIEQRQGDRRQRNSLVAELESFLEFDAGEVRPCGPGCERVCPECGETSCSCTCAPDCEHIPIAISSDPDNYPIEEAIAPLVFTLKRTGHYHPCWSCEGHLDARGDFWKIPRVWFYCPSLVYVRLLADVMQEFRIDGLTSVPWQVKVGFSDDDNPETTFSIRPDLSGHTDVTLDLLQNDVETIAKNLDRALRQRAEKVLAKAKATENIG